MRFLSVILCLLLFAPVKAAQDENGIVTDAVVLGALDKITARVNTLRGRVGVPMTFGTLKIIVRECVARPPEEPPESTAFLEIYQMHDENKETKVFSGWMFTSSPALSALDHPVYDVWVLGCENSASSNSP